MDLGTNHPIDARKIRTRLLAWYRKNRRDLPWRRTRDPYDIWISEIMLQQTRVVAVIRYYERFLQRFPNVSTLAQAKEQDLLAAWAGLGYYSRARNLQKAARKIMEAGAFPQDYSSIRDLAGVGDYTAAAIASIAFDLRYAALDGNVTRVLARLTAELGNTKSPVVRSRLKAVADKLIHPAHPGDFNQALMELGATVCLPRQPQCAQCPVAACCQARKQDKQNELPLRQARPESIEIKKQLLVVERAGKILVWQRPAQSKRLAGFWELPELENLPQARPTAKVAGFRHTIVNTNYFFAVFRASLRHAPDGFQWLAKRKIDEVPLSTTAKKALQCLAKHEGGLSS